MPVPPPCSPVPLAAILPILPKGWPIFEGPLGSTCPWQGWL